MIVSSRFADVANEPFSLQELARDTERRCVGDTHAEIIYKATETAIYKIGVAAAVDAKFPRSHFDSDMKFTMQWCARNPHPQHTHHHHLLKQLRPALVRAQSSPHTTTTTAAS